MSKLETPLVSVIMPTYNGEKYIARAIASILRQSVRDIELVVVDDGSSDHTPALLEALQQTDPRLRIVRHPANAGAAAAYNTGFAQARGEFIAVMDHDDVARPDRLEKALAFLRAHPEIDGCGARHTVLSPLGPVNAWRVPAQRLRARYLEPGTVAAFYLFSGVLYNPTMCFRRELLGRLENWFNPEFATGFDDDFYGRLIGTGAQMAVLPNVAILYRKRRSSQSRSHADIARAVRVQVSRRAVAGLIPDASPQELALHDRLVLRDSSLGPQDEAALRAWFLRLLAAGLPQWGDGLKHVLGLNWQRFCALMAANDFGAGLRAYRNFPELAGFTGSFLQLFYQFQKRALRRLFKKKR